MPDRKNQWYRSGAFWILIIGLTALAAGLFNDEFIRVMTKGSTICLECIGLG